MVNRGNTDNESILVHYRRRELRIMEATTFADFRKHLELYLDKAANGDEAVIVTRKGNKNVVLLSSAEYSNMLENMYVFGNKANCDWLAESLKQYHVE